MNRRSYRRKYGRTTCENSDHYRLCVTVGRPRGTIEEILYGTLTRKVKTFTGFKFEFIKILNRKVAPLRKESSVVFFQFKKNSTKSLKEIHKQDMTMK